MPWINAVVKITAKKVFFHCNRTGIFRAKSSGRENILFIFHPEHSCVFHWSVQIIANLESYV